MFMSEVCEGQWTQEHRPKEMAEGCAEPKDIRGLIPDLGTECRVEGDIRENSELQLLNELARLGEAEGTRGQEKEKERQEERGSSEMERRARRQHRREGQERRGDRRCERKQDK